VIAEPKALIGFAGPRVIEQTVREKLPEGFQRSEFLLEKGAIDMVIDRREMRNELAHLLALLTRQPADVVAQACPLEFRLSRLPGGNTKKALLRYATRLFCWTHALLDP